MSVDTVPPMPSTSKVRQALRASHCLDLFPPVQRPEHLLPGDAKSQWLCWPASELMAPYVAPAWQPPYDPLTARRHLVAWFRSLSDLLNESSRGLHSLMRLADPNDNLVDAMQAWLDGQWSSRSSLIELLWRLELGERTIGAALWLHRIGDDGTGRSSK